MRRAALLLLLLLGAGCGGASSGPTSASGSGSPDAACATAAAPGNPVKDPTGCRLPNGERFITAGFTCKDGGKLFQVTGPPYVFGRLGGVWQIDRDGAAAGDPAYGVAYRACQGVAPQSTTAPQSTAAVRSSAAVPPSTTPRPAVAVPTTAPRTAVPRPSASAPVNPGAVYYADCAAVRAAGKAPLLRGQPGYRSELDRNDDGVACQVK